MSSTTQYTLDQYKTDAQKQLAQQHQATKQSADINYQKLMKYLPQQTKGYSIGMTETAKIAANNALQRQLAQADMDYSGKMLELNNYLRTEQERLDDKEYQRRWNEDEREYNRGRDAIEDQRYENETTYNRQWNEDEREYQRGQDAANDTKTKQDSVFNEAKGIIEGGVWNTGDELMNYINGLDGKVSPEQYDILMQYASSIADNPEQKAADKEYVQSTTNPAKKTNVGSAVWYDDDSGFFGWGTADASGDNIEVHIPDADNADLNVQYDQKIEGENATTITNAFKTDHGREPTDGEVFGYNKKIYVYKNGVLWSLTGRGGSTGTGDYGELYKHYFG